MPVSLAATRRIALSLAHAVELPHFDRPSFRVGLPGKKPKIFATLWIDEGRAVAMLTPEQQDALVESKPAVFSPVQGTWGLLGATFIDLAQASTADVRTALTLAWTKAAPPALRTVKSPKSRSRAGASGTTPRRKK